MTPPPLPSAAALLPSAARIFPDFGLLLLYQKNKTSPGVREPRAAEVILSCTVLLVLLVNDSEYSQSAGAKPIFRSLLAVFISLPLARCAPHPTPPPFVGGGKYQKKENCVLMRWLLDMFASAWAMLVWRLVRVAHVV
jgi:hypothetical protein